MPSARFPLQRWPMINLRDKRREGESARTQTFDLARPCLSNRPGRPVYQKEEVSLLILLGEL